MKHLAHISTVSTVFIWATTTVVEPMTKSAEVTKVTPAAV